MLLTAASIILRFMVYQTRLFVRILVLALLLSGSLSQTAFAQREFSDTASIASIVADRQALLSIDPLESYAFRVQLIRQAQRQVDISTYIWGDDLAGRLMLLEILKAANRGVNVRLLIDDNGIRDLDPLLLALSYHPHIQIKLYNPFHLRRIKALEYLFRFNQLQRRMHSKSFIVDSDIAMIGGRNISGSYFRIGAETFFNDLDVVVRQQPAQAIYANFEQFWRSSQAVAVQNWLRASEQKQLAALEQMQQSERLPLAGLYLNEIRRSDQLQAWLAQRPAKSPPGYLASGPIQVVADRPDKTLAPVGFDQTLGAQISRIAGTAQHQLDIITPYLVPGDLGTQTLIQLRQRGVRVRILTNSLGSTDVPAIHSFYAKRRKALLAAGVELYEFKPDASNQVIRRWRVRERQRNRANGSLHAKIMVWDSRLSYIGSMNVDPRSIMINAEIGVMVPSQLLAYDIDQLFEQNIEQIAYRVLLTPRGSLNWRERRPDGTVVTHLREPETSLTRRAVAKATSILPIEHLM